MSKLTHHNLVHDNYNTHIVHCFTKSRQPDDGIWSVELTREIFFSKILQKMRKKD